MSAEASFFIGELARQTGTSRDTIRYYESVGVLPEPDRTPSGYRTYGPEDVSRLEFVDEAQTLGLTLDDIAEVLEIADEGREPCIHVRRTLESRLEQTRRRIRDLQAFERRLEEALVRASSDEAGSREACRCPIIEEGSQDSLPPPIQKEPAS